MANTVVKIAAGVVCGLVVWHVPGWVMGTANQALEQRAAVEQQQAYEDKMQAEAIASTKYALDKARNFPNQVQLTEFEKADNDAVIKRLEDSYRRLKSGETRWSEPAPD